MRRHGYDSVFYSIKLGPRKFWFDLTHDSQWLCKNWLNPRFKMDFWNLIEIDPDSKKLPRILIKLDSWLKNYLEYWFESSHDSKLRINCWFRWPFWAFTKFRWPFSGFHLISLSFFRVFAKFRWSFLAIRLKCLDSNQLMTRAISRRLESIQIMTQAAFQELTQNQLMNQVDSPGIDPDWLMTQSASSFFDSNQLMTPAKSIGLWVDSWFDSESYPCLVTG